MINIPKMKVGIVAVSRDCFPESLSVNRRKALVEAYAKKYDAADIYECPVCIVESEIHMVQALEDIKKAGCNALCVYLGNFGPEISETLLAKHFDGPKMFVAASEENTQTLASSRGDAYCGMLNASYNLKLRNIKAYIPEYPVGTAEECADMIHEFLPIAKAVYALNNLKIISFGPRPLNFLACNAPIKQLYNMGVEIEENSELDLFEAFNKHAGDERIPAKVKEMEKELGERTKEEILSQIQLKTEEQKKLEIHYKTVTEAREVLEKRMTELDSVIASLTEQLKESISISAEELNAQKENFAQQKKSLSENRDEIHARLEINSDMYEKIRRQQTELLKTETRWKWMKSLSDTANGTITGKARIMLETYIQMQYFDRILARANIRLMTMSSGQYELVRRKENKSRVGKTGLELDVVDHYNGTARSVKTLSGGETFQASLSLALGLSDEIQSSSGGIQFDTMFVDEGFGSLDEDALDQAIRALKDLSQGSRLVGIVSHVAELKERIDKKIIVTKKRTEDGVGSAICIEG